jgi:hypothetical protein
MRFAIAMILAAVSLPALASPDCSNVGPAPSSECATKVEYCAHNAIVLVLAVRAREAGMSEDANFSKLAGKDNREAWYVKHRDDVRDIVHQIYTNESAYQKLKVRIAPSAALAVSAIASGCNADTSVKIDPP